ncbi:YetF domain-containing protein [Ectobacillus sp. sgz5001026]|uniref:YetF domain-containing protein n=1 Tax=Ectobacillus sp. sgz5001026 TaxID=3242473 RepID=UPI0036D355B5
MNIDEFYQLDFWEIILRSTISFIVLLVLARLLGKKQLSQLTFFNYITGITIGSIAANIAGENETSFLNGLTSIIWWSFLTFVMEYIGIKSSKARIILDDEPTIVMKEGKILEKALKSVRLNIDDFSMMLREQGVFSSKDVSYAVLEPDGKLSILKKVENQLVTKKDLQVPTTIPKYLPTEIISDGEIVHKNLKELDVTKEWVLQQLKKQGIHSIEEVFYAEIQTDGSLYIDLKRDKIKTT